MNAYELADELQKYGLTGDNYGLFNKRIQNMLRQQANRIAELEEENRRIRERTWDSDFSRQFLAEIREAKAEVNK